MAITKCERPSRLAARWDEPMNGSWLATFAPDGDGTRVAFETTIEPGGLMGLLERIVRPWAKRQLAGRLESFRRWVECGQDR